MGPYIFLGASPPNATNCSSGSVVTGQFYGMIDEFRVFGKNLTTVDICHLANP